MNKPGTLAVVIRAGDAHSTPGIVDRIVEIIRPAVNGEQFQTIDGKPTLFRDDRPAWVVKSASPLPWICFGGPNKGKVHMFHERAICDVYLRPIGGVDVVDEIKDEVTA